MKFEVYGFNNNSYFHVIVILDTCGQESEI